MTEEFLRKLAKGQVVGDFYPFGTGNIDAVEKYIKQLINRLKDIRTINVEADFNYYGSGFASYINIRVSKKDNSDTIANDKKGILTRQTKGLLLYISNLTPYWYYGSSEWSVTTENGQFKAGSSTFLNIDSVDDNNNQFWDADIQKLKTIFDEFRYVLLTKRELEEKIDFDIHIPTVLADEPYKAFDCVFYWED